MIPPIDHLGALRDRMLGVVLKPFTDRDGQCLRLQTFRSQLSCARTGSFQTLGPAAPDGLPITQRFKTQACIGHICMLTVDNKDESMYS